MDFVVPADHRVKLKESEKNNKYLDFLRKLKKTVEHESDNYILDTVTEGLIKELEDLEITGQMETIQSTVLLRLARLLRRVLET